MLQILYMKVYCFRSHGLTIDLRGAVPPTEELIRWSPHLKTFGHPRLSLRMRTLTTVISINQSIYISICLSI